MPWLFIVNCVTQDRLFTETILFDRHVVLIKVSHGVAVYDVFNPLLRLVLLVCKLKVGVSALKRVDVCSLPFSRYMSGIQREVV